MMLDRELVFEPEDDGNPHVVCPFCRCLNVHPEYMKAIDGKDSGQAGWNGRGDLYVLGFWGECGHEFEVCFGFHKGTTFAFSRDKPVQKEE